MRDSLDKAKSILKRVAVRPRIFEVQGLTFEDVDSAAEGLGYPIYNLEIFLSFHRRALGLVGDKAKKIFLDHEWEKPSYIIFGRDGEMIYDAAATVFSGDEILNRVHLVTVSKPQADYIGGLDQFQKKREIFSDNLRAYLAMAGLSRESFNNQSKFVFVDSGYMGSMFDFVLKFFGMSRKALEARLTGYLISKSEHSPYRELGWADGLRDKDFFRDFYATFGKHWEEFKGSVVGLEKLEDWGIERRTNWALANYLQIQPKFHRRTLLIEKVGERWESLPSLEDRVYPLKDVHFLEPKNLNEDIKHPAHSSPVDPVAALKLQIATVEYFSRPEVRDKILRHAVYS